MFSILNFIVFVYQEETLYISLDSDHYKKIEDNYLEVNLDVGKKVADNRKRHVLQ